MWFLECGSMPKSTRTEHLVTLNQAIMRTNHARDIWDPSWLSTLEVLIMGRSVGVLKTKYTCVMWEEGISFQEGRLVSLSPRGLCGS